MAIEGYVDIYSKLHGPFHGNHKPGWKSSVIHQVSYAVTAPRDSATGQASGKRQHTPITITKEWGPATPQIFQALWNNEVLDTVEIVFVPPSASGKPPHKIRLKNAIVTAAHHIGGGKYTAVFDYEDIEVSGGPPVGPVAILYPTWVSH